MFLGGTGKLYQGILSTYSEDASGVFAAFTKSDNSSGLLFRVVLADITQQILVPKITLEAEYSLQTWIHLVFTYKYRKSIDLYLNGMARPNNEKSSGPGSGVEEATGELIIGATFLGQSNGYEAWMMFDELIIWEELIDADDVMRLYQAYQTVQT